MKLPDQNWSISGVDNMVIPCFVVVVIVKIGFGLLKESGKVELSGDS